MSIYISTFQQVHICLRSFLFQVVASVSISFFFFFFFLFSFSPWLSSRIIMSTLGIFDDCYPRFKFILSLFVYQPQHFELIRWMNRKRRRKKEKNAHEIIGTSLLNRRVLEMSVNVTTLKNLVLKNRKVWRRKTHSHTHLLIHS